jgi:hypothetical protein
VKAGQKRAVTFRVRRDRYTGPVRIEVVGLPAEVTLEPVTVSAGEDSVTAELTATRRAAPGPVALTVRATGGADSREHTAFLLVERPDGTFRLVLPTAPLELAPGEERTFEVRAVRDDLPGPIAVRFTDLPAGVSAADVTVPATADVVTATVRASSDAAAGDRRLAVLAQAGPVRAEGNVPLRLAIPPLRVLAPARVEVRPGETVRVPFTLKGGVEEEVTVRLTGLPRGAVAEDVRVPAGQSEGTATVRAASDVEGAGTECEITLAATGAVASGQARVRFQVLKLPPELKLEVVRPGKPGDPLVVLQGRTRSDLGAKVMRKNFDGPVKVSFKGLPAGVRLDDVTIPADSASADLRIVVDDGAKPGNVEVQAEAIGGGVSARSKLSLEVQARELTVEILSGSPGMRITRLDLKWLPVQDAAPVPPRGKYFVAITRRNVEGPVKVVFTKLPPGLSIKDVELADGEDRTPLSILARAFRLPKEETEIEVVATAGDKVVRLKVPLTVEMLVEKK